MNILDIQDKLKNFSQEQLIQEMQMPTGQLPQFLLLSEITRRKKMQDSYAQQQDQAQEQTTVAQDAINAAGIPQGEAQQLAGTMAPQTDMAGNTGAMPQQQMMPQAPQPVQGMAGGGIVALQDGGRITAPRIVVRNGQQMLEMPDGSIVPASPDSLRARLELISRMTDPESSFRKRLDQLRQPQPPANVAEMGMPSIGDVPAMAVPQIDQAPARIAQPGLLSLPTLGDSRPAELDAGPSATQSRLSPTHNLALPRATNVGGRAFVLTDDDRVLDAQTGAPATPEVAAEVMRRLNPQLSMADIVGGVSQIDSTGGGVNPSFPEDTSGQLPPMPSDVGPMSEPATTADPRAPFDMDAFQSDLTGVGRTILSPIVTAIDELPYDGPFISPVRPPSTPREDTHSADLRAAIAAAQDRQPYVNNLIQSVNSAVLKDIRNTATLISPFASDEEKDAAAALAGAPQLLPEPPVADTPPVVDKTTPPGPPSPPDGGGIAAAARGAAAPSDFEQELMTMLAAREKRATQDKFLALAQAGMALMSSTQPTFGGALGEAGAAGLGALREGQRGAEADRLALLGQIEQSRIGRERLDLERQALAARLAGSRGRGPTIPQLNAYAEYTATTLDALTGGQNPSMLIDKAVAAGDNQLVMRIQTAVAEDAAARTAYNNAMRGVGSAVGGVDPNFLDASANEE